MSRSLYPGSVRCYRLRLTPDLELVEVFDGDFAREVGGRGGRATLPVDWSTESSALRLTERHACQFFFEPFLLGGIGRMGQPVRNLKECNLLPLLCIETAFDQIDDDAVGTGAMALRERLNTPCHG